MKSFKFFNDGEEQSYDLTTPINPSLNLHPLLENEMIIHHWNHDHSELTARVIAWKRNIHAFTWRQLMFEGTMNEFFTNRFEVPVIISISVLGPHGETNRIYYETDDVFLSTHNFINYPIRIFYYAPI